jgi:hypothetical protein
MRWIVENDRIDQCAHGDVAFTIDSIRFVGGEDGQFLTVSAAALFLLRTLTHDHTPGASGGVGTAVSPLWFHGL